MKKYMMIGIALALILGVLSACSPAADNATAVQTTTSPTGETTQPPEDTQAAETTQTADAGTLHYAFEFSDVDGNVHKLSDYEGKPVYLEIWASWCSVCRSSLDALDSLAGSAEDFAVLSVVSPSFSGEKTKEEFITWYKGLGYKNLTVLLDENAQIVNDFGVTAYPTQVFFDANGNVVTGKIGLMSEDEIIAQMQEISQSS